MKNYRYMRKNINILSIYEMYSNEMYSYENSEKNF